MAATDILAPTFTLVALTGAVWLWMYAVRLRFIVKQRINPQSLDRRSAIPDVLGPANTPADNLNNLLEIPLLYYALVALLLVTGLADARFADFAWAFVLLRIVHSAIHLSYNRVTHRFMAYVASCLILGAMWARFAWTYYSIY